MYLYIYFHPLFFLILQPKNTRKDDMYIKWFLYIFVLWDTFPFIMLLSKQHETLTHITYIHIGIQIRSSKIINDSFQNGSLYFGHITYKSTANNPSFFLYLVPLANYKFCWIIINKMELISDKKFKISPFFTYLRFMVLIYLRQAFIETKSQIFMKGRRIR